jgi:tetratricopeptide (TPR) repeat protein
MSEGPGYLARLRLQRWLPYLLLAAATAAAFLPALRLGFTNWDDDFYVLENPYIRHLDPRSLAHIFDPRTLTAADWTPLVSLSHALEYRLFELDPAPYHATNLLLHLGATLAAYALLCAAGVPPAVAFAGAAVFGIHPLQVESVAWVSGRKNLLTALLGFLSVLLYLRRTPAARLGAMGLFALACLSKGLAVVVPPLLVATLLLRHAGGPRIRWRAEAPWLAALLLLALARGLWTVEAQSQVWARTATVELADRMAIMGGVLASYLRQLLWPAELRTFYGWPLPSWSDPRVLFGWTAASALAAALCLYARRLPWLSYLGAFGLITLAPMLNLFPAPFFQADRYLYMALPAAGALLAAPLYALAQRLGRPALATATLALWCGGVLAPFTLRLIPVWTSSLTLWTYTLRFEPTFYLAYNNLGTWHFKREEHEQAIDRYEQCLALKPDFLEARVGLAFAYLQTDRLGEAESHFREVAATRDDPWNQNRPRAYQGLAQVLRRQGKLAEAEAAYRISIQLNSDNAESLTNLGALLFDEGRFAEAERLYEQALYLRPELPDAHNNRGNLLRALGRIEEAARALERAIELDPTHAEAYSNLGALLVDSGKAAEAIPFFEKALELEPGLAEALSNLGNAYFALGQLEKALASYERALALKPDFPEALNNSGNALSLLGRDDDARARYERALALRAGFAPAEYGLGHSLLKAGRPGDALPLLQRARKAMPTFAEGAFDLGHAAWQTGNLDLAARSFEEVIRLQPNRLPAYQSLARVLAELGRPGDAEVVLQQAQARSPGSAHTPARQPWDPRSGGSK